VQDPVVRNFWTVEFASWNDKFAAEAVAPVLNKVGAFVANPLVRNIIGQPKSSFSVRPIMDEHKILLVNLSRGLLGEDNASLLGALLVTKIQLGAMSRADMPAEQRTPFYLYVDEFQNFATDSFATILSEARKYGLNLTVANQYTAQMAIEVKDAVFGNVGSIVAFRMGADDARSMLRYFEPKFEEYDLVHMHNRHFVISMTIEGEKTPAFSAISLNLPPQQTDYSAAIIENSRNRYASSKQYVERYVNERYQFDDFRPASAGSDRAPSRRPAEQKPQPQATNRPHYNTAGRDRPAERGNNGSISLPAGIVSQPTVQPNPSQGVVSSDPSVQSSDDGAVSPKRKRTRHRKRKTPTTDTPGSADVARTTTPAPEQEIILKH